ncbi:hypothetical protein RFM98_15000 [Mesorhizobium sp. VK9D]|nr:hypothetical protein [Mesorhizobium sp. VK9D]MDX8454067.1 hypothetical protein [Mesorhizobium sp. VK9D]
MTLFKVIARSSYEDIKATGELIAGSDLDWTWCAFHSSRTVPPMAA